MPLPQLVIFDCDGVLIDSEAIACRIDAECLTAAGFPTTFEDVRERYVGRSAASMFADIERRQGRPLPAAFPETLHALTRRAFDAELRAMPGAAALLDRLRMPACVASSSLPDRLRQSLAVAGLLSRFEPHIFSAAQVENGKPAPDLFLFAAAQMGVAPACCLVVEDSTAGIAAARAAGMRVIGFSGGSHCPPGHRAVLEAAGAERVVAHMDALVLDA